MISMQVRHNILLFILFALFTACSGSLSSEKYIRYLEDGKNGMRITRTINDVSFTAQYKPLDLLLARKMRSGGGETADAARYKSTADSLLRFDFYIVTADGAEHPYRYNVANTAAYTDRKFYYEFGGVASAFYIEGPQGKIYPFSCRAEQNGTLTNTLVLECMFDLPLPEKELIFCFEDRIFGKGIVKFRFDTEQIRNLPTLKHNS